MRSSMPLLPGTSRAIAPALESTRLRSPAAHSCRGRQLSATLGPGDSPGLLQYLPTRPQAGPPRHGVMDFDQLHTFLEIVRLKSFSKAAQTCFRTQPAISAQVRQLEQELHTSLFERFGTRISLTTAGKIFARIRRADARPPAAGAGRHRRAGARSPRRTRHRRQRSHLHLRSAGSFRSTGSSFPASSSR